MWRVGSQVEAGVFGALVPGVNVRERCWGGPGTYVNVETDFWRARGADVEPDLWSGLRAVVGMGPLRANMEQMQRRSFRTDLEWTQRRTTRSEMRRVHMPPYQADLESAQSYNFRADLGQTYGQKTLSTGKEPRTPKQTHLGECDGAVPTTPKPTAKKRRRNRQCQNHACINWRQFGPFKKMQNKCKTQCV